MIFVYMGIAALLILLIMENMAIFMAVRIILNVNLKRNQMTNQYSLIPRI